MKTAFEMNYTLFYGRLNERQKENLKEFKNLIYLSAFPDAKEQETFDTIIDRIEAAGKIYPGTIAIMAYNGKELCGGMIADCYPAQKSIEIIYIAVNKKYLKKGVGSGLLKEGINLISKKLGKDNVLHVFAEVESPFENCVENGYIDPVSRLKFFDKNGAARIPIKYVQPPLKPGGDFARNLFLIYLPVPGSSSKKLTKTELRDFIDAFYLGLENNTPKDKYREELERLHAEIDNVDNGSGSIYFDDLVEKPRFKIKNASVAIHYNSVLGEPITQSCDIFYSYESDLMNFSNQSGNRRILSKHIKKEENVTLVMPEYYKYTSEGLTHIRMSANTTLSVQISLNLSYAPESGKHLAHLVIKPKDWFYENDLIKLVHFFGSKQEKTEFSKNPGILSGNNILSFQEWIRLNLPGIQESELPELQGTGLSEIDLGKIERINPKSSGKVENVIPSFEDFRKGILSNDNKRIEWNKTVCGILLGIFDFDRMNTKEIDDTIRPIVEKPSSFMLISRGHLMKLMYVSTKSDEQDEDILISPYMLVPSAVLAFNENLLREERSEIEKLSPDIKAHIFKDRDYYHKSNEIRRKVEQVQMRVDNNYIRDIFQYPSEKEILGHGSKERGLNTLHRQLTAQMRHLWGISEGYMKEYRNGTEKDQNMLLLVLAILQVVIAVQSDLEWWIKASVCVLLIVLFWFLGRFRLWKNRMGEKD